MATKQSKSKSTKNQIDVSPLDDIRQEERLSILAEELIKMKSKRKIIEEYSEKWQCSPSTIRALINESIVWLSTTVKVSREEIRALNSERLEELFDDATLRDKLKIIDLLNKSHGVYDTNIVVSTNDPITIDLGL
jgi:hypothetical protein